jgi:hypothetical protein
MVNMLRGERPVTAAAATSDPESGMDYAGK